MQALVNYTTQIVGLDLSGNMVAEYKKSAVELGFGPERMNAYQHDLLGESETPSAVPELDKFDIAIVSMALHHVEDPGKLLQKLSEQLKPGGVCVIVDMIPRSHDEIKAIVPSDKKEVLQTINKKGFAEEELKSLYDSAGMGKNFEYVVIEKPFEATMSGKTLSIPAFIARGELL
jgi:SAM-dependent methyltransferase